MRRITGNFGITACYMEKRIYLYLMTHLPTMRKGFNILLTLLVFISACSSNNAPKDNIDSQIDIIKQTSDKITSFMNTANDSLQQPSQVVYVPAQQQPSVTQGNDILSIDYAMPCSLQKYKVINSYCSFKTFW